MEVKRLSTVTYMHDNGIAIRDKINCILQELNDRFKKIPHDSQVALNTLELHNSKLEARCWWRDSAVLYSFKDLTQANEVCKLLSEWGYHKPTVARTKYKCECEYCEENNIEWHDSIVVIFTENEQSHSNREILEEFYDEQEFKLLQEA